MSIDISNMEYSDVVQMAQQINRLVAIKRVGDYVRMVVE